ncbi:MAG: hypothetical protein KDC88_12700 [Ignavibacteriae bacterium]|nr:hypothetical protein [Ignavibacteriota bacterium]
MKNISKILAFLFCIILVLDQNILTYAQNDSTNNVKTLTSIEDSSSVVDSLFSNNKSKPFLVNFEKQSTQLPLPLYNIIKEQIDKLDYRYSGNILNWLPFSFLYDLGYLGSPNEMNIYGMSFGNFGIQNDGLDLTNRWNSSADLNLIQTERISKLSLVPLHKGFLNGFTNNPALINVEINDTLKSKPFSRIRYTQASYDEGFIDAFFSARVLSKLALSFRVTNISRGNNYANTDYGSWKVNVKAIYKLTDSLFSKIIFNHAKLFTSLNGGIDLTGVELNSSDVESYIFNSQALVLNNNLINRTTINNFDLSVYGNIFPIMYSFLRVGHSTNEDQYKGTFEDTLKVKNINDYKSIYAYLRNNILYNDISLSINGGIENIDYNLEGIGFQKNLTNYFANFQLSTNVYNNIFTPSVFSKYSKFNIQSQFGFGADLSIKPLKNSNILAGYSSFNKPYSIVESMYLGHELDQKNNLLFLSLDINSNFIKTAISYFSSNIENAAIPIMNSNDLKLNSTGVEFISLDKNSLSGFNINSQIEILNILATANFNYYLYDDNSIIPKESNYNLTAGLYYVDTLYNSNLDLKTGFTFYLFDDVVNKVYDFQKMRSSSFFNNNSNFTAFDFYPLALNPYRLDFFLAGRIQESATIYFVYENILGNNYYIIPYYPMDNGGIRIGISWDFLD